MPMERSDDFVVMGAILLVVVFIVHFNVRGVRHPDWRPWHATARCLYEFLWPCFLAYGAIWLALTVIGDEASPLDHTFWFVIVGIPAMARAHSILTKPPGG